MMMMMMLRPKEQPGTSSEDQSQPSNSFPNFYEAHSRPSSSLSSSSATSTSSANRFQGYDSDQPQPSSNFHDVRSRPSSSTSSSAVFSNVERSVD